MWWIHWPGALLELKVNVLNSTGPAFQYSMSTTKGGAAQGLESDLSGYTMAAFALPTKCVNTIAQLLCAGLGLVHMRLIQRLFYLTQFRHQPLKDSGTHTHPLRCLHDSHIQRLRIGQLSLEV